MRNLKIKSQHFLPDRRPSVQQACKNFLLSLILLQKILHGRRKPCKRAHKGGCLLLAKTNIVFTLPLQRQKLPVTSLQLPVHPSVILLHHLFQSKKILFPQGRTVHIPPPLHQIMRLVNQKNIIFPYPLGKETLQIHVRVKEIIIIAYNRIRKQTHIKAKLKGTDPVLSGTGADCVPVKTVPTGQQLVNSVIDAVIVSLCIRTVIRVALGLPHKTDLVPCGQYYRF